ncbi:MAG: amidase [Hyphomicrobiaceae bacterium]
MRLHDCVPRRRRRAEIRGPLHGIPVGIKDIIDVEGMTTLCNSRSRAGSRPARGDAEIVLALKRQGAIVLGKVHTTEYAFFDPSPARNPWNLEHTPGGSSSGSAAAVAAGMVPLALGTQTVASVNRPAAYCGISAFKPSTRSICMWGIAPLAPSYDTIGFMAQTVDDAVYAYEATMPPFVAAGAADDDGRPLVVWMPQDTHIADCDAEIVAAVDAAADALAGAGHSIRRVPSPVPFERLFKLQRMTTLYDAARALAFLEDKPADTVGAKLREAMDEGRATSTADYLDARAEIDAMRVAFWQATAGADACLWPATPRTAPEGLAWTGDPKYIAPWTALAGPIVSLPLRRHSNGLPVGAIVSSAPGSDRRMCGMARRIAGILGA